MKLSSESVRRSLSAHSWLGLMAGALMYLVCLTGALVVFSEEFERWEQPYAPEFREYDLAGMEKTFNEYLQRDAGVTPHMYLVLPTEAVPRARVASEAESWFLDADGSVAAPERNDWTEMLVDLHYYLHLPESWGMILVSTLGALLVGLVVSGLFAHPRIFRDAFSLRLRGSRRLEQADIHNRLSVWGVPFYVVIAITGAYFGLALPFLGAVAELEFGGDRQAALEAVFGKEPKLDAQAPGIRLQPAIRKVASLAPDATPLFVTVHDAGTPGQFFTVAAHHPNRLSYAENYVFDSDGHFLGAQGFTDGAVGKQVLYSVYRLHFGHFGGWFVKVLYGLLGMALTVVVATGINVWLARRKQQDALNDAWVAVVWGAPLALLVAAIAQIALDWPAAPAFWTTLGGIVAACLARHDEVRSRRLLQSLIAASGGVLVVAMLVRFGARSLQGMPAVINTAILLSGAVAIALFSWPRPTTAARSRHGRPS